MVDPRFHPSMGPCSLQEIAARAGAAIPHGTDPATPIHGLAVLEDAEPGSLAFCESERHARRLGTTRATAVIVPEALRDRVPASSVPLVVEHPMLAWIAAADLFHPQAKVATRGGPDVHPSASIAPDAELGDDLELGPFAVIGARASIGAGCTIGAHAVIGPGCVIGPSCWIDAHVTISHALIGARVRIYPGARIGQDGFGFVPGPSGFVSVPQLGRVVVEDDVEIGANTTVDRGALSDTVIGRGTRIDNLVQIGHNVRIGPASVLVAQSGISGSTRLGKQVVVGGQAGFAGHLSIGDRARIGAQAGVASDVGPGMDVSGSPARPLREVRTAEALLYAQVRERARRHARAAHEDGHATKSGGEAAEDRDASARPHE